MIHVTSPREELAVQVTTPIDINMQH